MITFARKNAVLIGILFILGTSFGIFSGSFLNPSFTASDFLVKIAENQKQVSVGGSLILLMGLSCAAIGPALYPVLKKFSPGLAIGAVSFRLIESMLEILLAMIIFLLVATGQSLTLSGMQNIAAFEPVASVLKAGMDWLNAGAMLIPWCIAAFMYYWIFYQYKLLPRWISIWGFIGISLSMISTTLNFVNPDFVRLQFIFSMPIFFQELVMAGWMIIKGFNPVKASVLEG